MPVLIATGQNRLATALLAVLQTSGCEAFVADSASAAIERARRITPKLLITEFALRGLSGVETAMRIRDVAPQCTTLIVSGQVETLESLRIAVNRIIATVGLGSGGPLLWLDLNRRADSDSARVPIIKTKQSKKEVRFEIFPSRVA